MSERRGVYVLAARPFGPCTGLLAVASMASIPRAAMHTHHASVDVLHGTTTALTLRASCALTKRKTPALAFVCGVCVALAASTKCNGIVFGAAPAWVLLEGGGA